MKKNDEIQQTQIVLYRSLNNDVTVEVFLKDDTFWMTQKAMAKLFDKDIRTISLHINNIYKEGELEKGSSETFSRKTGKSSRPATLYNLDMVISVGYRVNSKKATHFRKWATKVLNEYIRKGYVLDDYRLKELGGGGYFKELIERIRDIRASEKVFYRQVLEIYATSVDYDPQAEISIDFFKKVQNKIHYAVHGSTASEVIYERADAEKDFMGLTTFKGAQPSLAEAKVAKNYLDEKELKAMGQIVSGYLDFAERQAEREVAMTMEDWAKHLNNVLTSSGEKLLVGSGSVSHQKAVNKVEREYKKYQQRTLSAVEKDYLDAVSNLNKKVSG